MTMPKPKTDRPADATAVGTLPGDLAHEIALLGAALGLTAEQRAAAHVSDASVAGGDLIAVAWAV